MQSGPKPVYPGSYCLGDPRQQALTRPRSKAANAGTQRKALRDFEKSQGFLGLAEAEQASH